MAELTKTLPLSETISSQSGARSKRQEVLRYIKNHPAAGYLDVALACDLELPEAVQICQALIQQGRVTGRPASE